MTLERPMRWMDSTHPPVERTISSHRLQPACDATDFADLVGTELRSRGDHPDTSFWADSVQAAVTPKILSEKSSA